MNFPSTIEGENQARPPVSASRFIARSGFWILTAVALIYSFLASLHTVGDYDLFWQMATGRWVAQHHTVFSTDVFSYTAQGQPWVYPVGSGLLFYGAFLLGGYGLISWLGAAACVGTVVLLLRSGSPITAVLAIVAVPAIAARTVPRADMFTVVLFAAFLSLLWEQYETGSSKLWLLPLLMVAWVNLHLGFVAGLALVCGYAALEAMRLWDRQQRQSAQQRLRATLPWLAATFLATLVNPWGWGIYRALYRQEAAMGVHSARIAEWAGVSLSWTSLREGWSLQDPTSPGKWVLLLLLSAAVAVVVATFRQLWPAAVLLAGGLWMATRHSRFLALLACVVVVVGGRVLTPALEAVRARLRDQRMYSILGGGAVAALILLASLRSVGLVSDRCYFNGNETQSFGAGLSSWFSERAMAFVEREHLPAQIFNSYEEGGYLVWRLGPQYRDYIDGRAIPFGAEFLNHLQRVLQAPPDSPQWRHEADTYGINTALFSLARYDGLEQVRSVLPYYCRSENWRPVYLDEVSAVFVRRGPETQALIERFPVDCATAPLPAGTPSDDRAEEFNRWANAANLLLALQRNQEAVAAATKGLSIYSDRAALWYVRGKALLSTGHQREAEQSLLQSAALEVNLTTWTELANLYRSQRRFPAAIDALEKLADLSPEPPSVLVALGDTYLEAGDAKRALAALDRAEKALPQANGHAALAEINHERALAWSMLGDVGQAIGFEEKAVGLAPQAANYWNQLARYYDLQGQAADARRASEKAAALASGQNR